MSKGKESYDDWNHRESNNKQKILRIRTEEVEIYEMEDFDMGIKLSEKDSDIDDDYDHGYHITLMVPFVFSLN